MGTDMLKSPGGVLLKLAPLGLTAYAENSRRWVAVGSGGTILTKY